ncbi:ATP-binding cassette domain-containing protein [Thermococcus sp. AM4]|uniref:ATP-binding cassette domain-containing protein n=1 Tax=Thermococcus sp. (strain AM4) TaxID=246969 RepID=UPI001ED91275|nr:ABC transporter ATP-binding protein [Thermococcus sp. AM4]
MKALDNVSFTLTEGISYILGPNGSGKSTLIKILAGLIRQDSGDVKIKGVPLGEYPSKQVGFAFERPVIHPRLVVGEHIRDVATYRGEDNSDDLIQIFGLDEVKNKRFGELSMGYKRRFLVALAFAGFPDVVFLDEPFSNVDIVAKMEIMDGIKTLRKKHNISVVIVSHVFDNIPEIDSLVVLYGGRVIANPIGKEIRLLRKIRFVFSDEVVENNIKRAVELIRAGKDPKVVECIGVEEGIMELLKKKSNET